jgi:hypothetical protein
MYETIPASTVVDMIVDLVLSFVFVVVVGIDDDDGSTTVFALATSAVVVVVVVVVIPTPLVVISSTNSGPASGILRLPVNAPAAPAYIMASSEDEVVEVVVSVSVVAAVDDDGDDDDDDGGGDVVTPMTFATTRPVSTPAPTTGASGPRLNPIDDVSKQSPNNVTR